jgi:ABC-2 type transport system ATP-binding protein
VPLLRSLDADGIELGGVELRRPTLDDVFLTLTGRSLRDGENNTAPADTPPTRDGAAA